MGQAVPRPPISGLELPKDNEQLKGSRRLSKKERERPRDPSSVKPPTEGQQLRIDSAFPCPNYIAIPTRSFRKIKLFSFAANDTSQFWLRDSYEPDISCCFERRSREGSCDTFRFPRNPKRSQELPPKSFSNKSTSQTLSLITRDADRDVRCEHWGRIIDSESPIEKHSPHFDHATASS